MGCIQPNNSSKGVKRPAIKVNQGAVQLRQNYDINPQLLGTGSFGKVFMASNKADPSHKVAIKVLNKTKLTPEEIKEIQDEIQILIELDHPNIVKYYETYDDVKFIYLVMELCPGGELFERITQKKSPISEKEAAQILEKILKAINHCHKQNIIHRDIKPENIMYGKDGEVKLIDFGLAKQVKDQNSHLRTIAGTPYFISPDVLNGNYGKECDIWSLGVVFYMMMTGKYPFDGNNRVEVFNKIRSGKFQFPRNASPECCDLLTRMICVDPKERITAQAALQHPWLKHVLNLPDEEAQKLDTEILSQLKKFKGSSKLRMAALNVLVKMISPGDIALLRREFEKIDKDNSGTIEIAELEEAVKRSNVDLSDEDLKSILKELDYSNDKTINYTEFIGATIQIQNFLTDSKLEALFKQFDMDGDQEITMDNIRDAMRNLGKEISDDDLEEIMKMHDLSGDKKLQLNEFKMMMLGVA